jgi:hypothetical protein
VLLLLLLKHVGSGCLLTLLQYNSSTTFCFNSPLPSRVFYFLLQLLSRCFCRLLLLQELFEEALTTDCFGFLALARLL